MRVGLLGAGRIGSFHAATLRDHPGVTEIVIADADPAAAERLAATVAATPVASAADALAGGLDALVVAAATPAHAPLVRAAADAGVPVFCEKPIALTLEETREVIEHVTASDVVLQVGFQRRFDPAYLDARTRVHHGDLGRLYHLRMVSADAEPPPATYLAASGGIFRDMHVHDFDLARWLTGSEVVEVYATGSATGCARFAADDDLQAAATLLTLADGTLATITGARHNPTGYDVRTEIVGAAGAMFVGLDERTPLDVALGPRPAQPYTSFLDRFEAAYRAEISAFVALVSDGGASPCAGSDALEALHIALAAERSVAERRPVLVEETR